MALQAVLAESSTHALVALTHALALQVFGRHAAHRRSSLQLRALLPRQELLRAADDLPASLDMRAWWEPTGPGYLQHVSKAQVIQALQQAQGASGECAGQGAGVDLAKLKKPALVAHAVRALAGRGWLPSELQALQPLSPREG